MKHRPEHWYGTKIMGVRTIDEILSPWVKRHGLRVSNVYRDRFYYVDIFDDTGGRYEISIFEDDQPDLIKVRVSSNRKRSCGFIGVGPSELEGVLEQA
ncbi:MAG TPA: hypothetical protein VE360_08490, partial [Pyrinomonadaceae bacterium]|nr:hypothetical protein [Pyrinomonadaceae bacterium]